VGLGTARQCHRCLLSIQGIKSISQLFIEQSQSISRIKIMRLLDGDENMDSRLQPIDESSGKMEDV
jgi:hypothetical protein